MRIAIFIFFAILIITDLFAQNSKGKLYKSFEDYKAKNSVEGYDVQLDTWRIVEDFESLLVSNHGVTFRVIVSNLPEPFIAPEEGGILIRAYNEKLYYVLAEGPVCYYMRRGEAEVIMDKEGYRFVRQMEGEVWGDYYSEAINGPIKKLSKGELEKRLKERGLKEKFEEENPKGNVKDFSDEVLTKRKNVIAKYIRLQNNTPVLN